jgi:hypothetical protein
MSFMIYSSFELGRMDVRDLQFTRRNDKFIQNYGVNTSSEEIIREAYSQMEG